MKHFLFACTVFFYFSSMAEITEDMTAPDLPESEAVKTNFTEQIINIAMTSSCRQYKWKERGKAPSGYVKGLAVTYGRSFCQLKAPPITTAAAAMEPVKTMCAELSTTKKDALSHYQSSFQQCHINNRTADEGELLRSLYTLGMGLGMRESSGKYCEGYDIQSRQTASTAEAGLFQTSYNSMSASPALKNLFLEYKAHPERCLLDLYKEDVNCKKSKNSAIIGQGEGAEFQQLSKTCPAFATEYAMIMLRVRRSHYGPINRRAAEIRPECHEMFDKIESLIKANQDAACAELH